MTLRRRHGTIGSRRIMPIFLLTPRELDASDWAMSTHRKPVQVEASDEQEARRLAALRYGLDRRARRSESVGALAWRMPRLVTAQVVHAVDPDVALIADAPPAERDWARRAAR